MTTAVVTERRGVVLEQDRSRGLEIHLYERGSNTALCGHVAGENAHRIPWAMGSEDCETCWGLYIDRCRP